RGRGGGGGRRAGGKTGNQPAGGGGGSRAGGQGRGRGEGAPAVLVIDDDRQIRRLLRTAFELGGFAVRDAGSAGEGIQSAADKPPDLIILDLRLPDMDGGNVLRRLRTWAKLPVIGLSVRASEGG